MANLRQLIMNLQAYYDEFGDVPVYLKIRGDGCGRREPYVDSDFDDFDKSEGVSVLIIGRG